MKNKPLLITVLVLLLIPLVYLIDYKTQGCVQGFGTERVCGEEALHDVKSMTWFCGVALVAFVLSYFFRERTDDEK